MKQSFLCGSCNRLMCDDCKSIAEEYAVLYAGQKSYLIKAEDEVKRLRQEIEVLKQGRDDYKRILGLGVGPQIVAWMNSLTPAQLRSAVEKAVR